MSPLDRLDWLAQVAADQRLTIGAVRVAIAMTKWIGRSSGTAFPAVATIGAVVGMKERGTRQVLRQLEAAGWLTVKRSLGRASNTYTLTFATQHGHAGSTQHGDAGSAIGNPAPERRQPGTTDAANPAQRVPPNKGEQGEQESDPLFAVLVEKRAMRKRQGRDITQEWTALTADLGLIPDQLGTLLHRLAPRDRWPSKVRALAEAEADGLVLTERKATADEIRDAMGLPAGEPANG